jgi:tetratricopeptide (TPR) repeat protein
MGRTFSSRIALEISFIRGTTKIFHKTWQERSMETFRAYIECDGCGQRDPAHKCSRCKCAFYCSVDCQRQHWNKEHKKTCVPIEKIVQAIPEVEDSLVTPLNSECGICLEEPIKQPVVLPDCRHAFCFSCLSNWQGDCNDAKPQNLMWEMLGRTENITKFCPFCRKEIGKSVTRDVLIKAHIYQAQARRLAQSTRESERMELLQKAVSECDKVLEVDPNDLDALKLKVGALVQFNPTETVAVAKRSLCVHAVGNEKLRRLKEQLEEFFVLDASGNEAGANKLYDEITTQYNVASPWPRILGSRPDAAFPFRVLLSNAYEDLNQIPDAYREYKAMMNWYQDDEEKTGKVESNPDSIRFIRDVLMGCSRCMLALGNFDEALNAGEDVLRMGRHSAGAHMLVAKAQRALARPPPITTHSLAGRTNKLTSTMADAVETMYRGVVYETPWDENNQRVNREFLQELLHEIGEKGC